ncbi:MAG: hypothetical protein LBP50_00210, partial [Tannerella sp.]|nr:hypothetical protein [Tannerella sp.]
LGYDGVYRLRDLWRQTDLGLSDRVKSFDIPRHGCVLIRML